MKICNIRKRKKINYFIKCSGYMAPEYAMRGYLSVKADVFSFGVLVLEIVSGRKNQDKQLGVEKADLLHYVSYFLGQFKHLSLKLLFINLKRHKKIDGFNVFRIVRALDYKLEDIDWSPNDCCLSGSPIV